MLFGPLQLLLPLDHFLNILLFCKEGLCLFPLLFAYFLEVEDSERFDLEDCVKAVVGKIANKVANETQSLQVGARQSYGVNLRNDTNGVICEHEILKTLNVFSKAFLNFRDFVII